MLLCSIDEIEPGMTVAATVRHPARPETELVALGFELDAGLIEKLKKFEVARVWVDHDATRDLDSKLNVDASPARRAVLTKLQDSFRETGAKTVSTADLSDYKQVVGELVCELTGNRELAPLAERLASSSGHLFEHSASVAYVSVLVALELESYIVSQRAKLDTDRARDITALGIGAILHDIGKLALKDPKAGKLNVVAEDRLRQKLIDEERDEHLLDPLFNEYHRHAVLGYRMLERANAPASARQVVLGHHQRWDGTGYPDMGEVTEGRIEGAQQGERIHIFCRIVAAADLLEHLLRDASGKQRPVIAALHTFHSHAYDNWFDPVVRDTVLRKIAPFAVGSRVTLNTGQSAVVLEPNPIQPCLPIIRLLGPDAESAEVIELFERRELSIVSCAGEEVEPYLYFLPEQDPLSKRFRVAG